MTTQELYEVLKYNINNTLDNLSEDPHVTKGLLANIVNQIINERFSDAKDPNLFLKLKVKEKFSGRGNAWVKVDSSNDLFDRVIKLLSVDTSSLDFYQASSYKDIFSDNKFCWLRYAGISDVKGVQFHIRIHGSKNVEHIKVYTDLNTANNLVMLEGVPHRIGLESGEKLVKHETSKIIDDLPLPNDHGFFTTIDDI